MSAPTVSADPIAALEGWRLGGEERWYTLNSPLLLDRVPYAHRWEVELYEGPDDTRMLAEASAPALSDAVEKVLDLWRAST